MTASRQLVVLIYIVILLPVTVGRRVHASKSGDGQGLLQNEEFKGIPSPKGQAAPKGLTVIRRIGRRKRHGRRSAHRHQAIQVLQVAGSALPDCSHTCGGCSPCRRVTVSFKCSLLQESESCPIAYRCMCRGKSFPVP